MSGTPANLDVSLVIVQVQALESSTIVSYTFTSSKPRIWFGKTPWGWAEAPTLVDPVGKKAYAVNSFASAPWETNLGIVAEDSYARAALVAASTAQYPALPEGVTTVEIRLEHFAPVQVPVTR